MSKSYGEQFELALACQTKEQATEWLRQEIESYIVDYCNDWTNRYPNNEKGRQEAERVIKVNLGYMAGYYDSATAHKIQELFGAVHPIFGSADYFETVSPKQAFKMGQDMANKK